MPVNYDEVRAAAAAGGVGFWRWDRAVQLVAWDDTLTALFAAAPGEFGGSFESWAARVHPDDWPDVQRELDAALRERRAHSFRHRVAGVVPERWLEARGDVILDDVGEVVGTIGCVWDVTEHVENDRQLQQALQALAAAAEVDAITRDRFEFLSLLNDALTPSDPREAVRNAASVAVPRLGDWCAVALVDDRDEHEVHIEVAHRDPDLVHHVRDFVSRVPVDPAERGVLADVIRTGSTQFVPVVEESMLAALNDDRRDFVVGLGPRSAIIVPVRGPGRNRGAVVVANSSTRRSFTPDDVILVHALADRLGVALENRRLEADLRRDEFRAALDSLMDHVTIARAVRDASGSVVDFTMEFINESSRDGAGRGPEQLVGTRVLDSYPGLRESGLFDRYVQVTEEREPLVVDRMRYDDVAPDGTPIEGWWSVRVVPFRDGYLATSRDETEAIRSEQVVREAEADHERTVHAMRVLQSTALPAVLPQEPGLSFAVRYEPANERLPVGGDWYDAFVVPERGIGVVIADVAGHGMEAAGVMLRIRNALRAYAVEGGDPGEVLGRVNHLLTAQPDGGPFVTCAYALLDVAGAAMTWASAGHHLPVRSRGGRAQPLHCAVGPPLGVDPAATYTSSVEQLADSDLIVWFTDGLMERRDEPIDVSLESLYAAIGVLDGGEVESVVDALVRRRSDSGVLDDDAAVIAVRYGPPR